MPDRDCDVSVIVPTFNRASRLDTLLDDLSHQDADGHTFEVIVVDNGSVDDTARVVHEWSARDPRIHYLLERRPGASCARNAGIAAAAAPILAFIDDDVRPARDWVASVCRTFALHRDLDCVGGRIEARWPTPPPAWLTSAHFGPLALQSGRGAESPVDRQHAAACLVTANFACRAAVFRELGGFSPDYLRDEDREFNLRMWRAGKRGMYVDSVITFTEVQPERLEKRYHRAWHHVTGTSHARMRYRDIVTREGVLDDAMTSGGRLIGGVPLFLVREWITHAREWVMKTIARKHDLAFFEECRLRYLSSYIATRWSSWLRTTMRSRAGRSAVDGQDTNGGLDDRRGRAVRFMRR
jgi:glycosyltransferase involved in cell wall biosynthesis